MIKKEEIDTSGVPLIDLGSESEAIDSEYLISLYRLMLRIRIAEERVAELFADGEIPGFIHLSIGQEAVAVGVMSVLGAADTIASTHRGHGHGIAKGLALKGLFAELFGRDQGLCRGRGGSMHVADVAIGMLGANGVVGAGLSIALGSALAHKILGRSAIAVAFFGDGALAEGLLHESLNLAVLRKLPVLFVCENNGWSEFSPTASQVAFSLDGLAGAFGIPFTEVDGNDVLSVARKAAMLVGRMREGAGPAILECLTTRLRGHYEGDAQKYRTGEDLASAAARDPVELARRRFGIRQSELDRIESGVRQEVEAAIVLARESPMPKFADALCDVYTATTSQYA
jgi:acetoin:2,6-dichlorophenolindophenol oxidoreductase subunit alpha